MTSAHISWAKASHMAMPNLKGGQEVQLSYVSPSRAVNTIMIITDDQRNFMNALKNKNPSRTHKDYHLILEVHRSHLILIYMPNPKDRELNFGLTKLQKESA